MMVCVIDLHIGNRISQGCVPAYFATTGIKSNHEARILVRDIHHMRLGIHGYSLWIASSVQHANDRKASIGIGDGREQAYGQELCCQHSKGRQYSRGRACPYPVAYPSYPVWGT